MGEIPKNMEWELTRVEELPSGFGVAKYVRNDDKAHAVYKDGDLVEVSIWLDLVIATFYVSNQGGLWNYEKLGDSEYGIEEKEDSVVLAKIDPDGIEDILSVPRRLVL